MSYPTLWRAGWLVAFVAVVSVNCTDPELREDTMLACHNGADDDQNGGADCADPACAMFCESSQASCDNGIDDDDNGKADCEEPVCIARGWCKPLHKVCDPLLSLCPKGLGCSAPNIYAFPSQAATCEVAGTAGDYERCSANVPCAANFLCISSICARACADNTRCAFASPCITNGKGLGVCVAPCIPTDTSDSCTRAGTCSTFSELGYSGAAAVLSHGALSDFAAVCFDRDGAFKGSVAEGAECSVTPILNSPTDNCEHGLVCTDLGAAKNVGKCRAICAFARAGKTPIIPCTDTNATCTRLPLDPSKPSFASDDRAPGVCITP